MNFIDSYKKLEKLCNEMYGDKHGVSLYIDEMINTPVGSCYVKSWNEDLKQLKHYRWVRNQIVHEPGCTETNMCNRDDIQWINNFYTRMMSTSDPLALYRKTIRSNRKTHSSSGGNRHRGSVTIHNKKESTVDFHRNLTGVECSFGAL